MTEEKIVYWPSMREKLKNIFLKPDRLKRLKKYYKMIEPEETTEGFENWNGGQIETYLLLMRREIDFERCNEDEIHQRGCSLLGTIGLVLTLLAAFVIPKDVSINVLYAASIAMTLLVIAAYFTIGSVKPLRRARISTASHSGNYKDAKTEDELKVIILRETIFELDQLKVIVSRKVKMFTHSLYFVLFSLIAIAAMFIIYAFQ